MAVNLWNSRFVKVLRRLQELGVKFDDLGKQLALTSVASEAAIGQCSVIADYFEEQEQIRFAWALRGYEEIPQRETMTKPDPLIMMAALVVLLDQQGSTEDLRLPTPMGAIGPTGIAGTTGPRGLSGMARPGPGLQPIPLPNILGPPGTPHLFLDHPLPGQTEAGDLFQRYLDVSVNLSRDSGGEAFGYVRNVTTSCRLDVRGILHPWARDALHSYNLRELSVTNIGPYGNGEPGGQCRLIVNNIAWHQSHDQGGPWDRVEIWGTILSATPLRQEEPRGMTGTVVPMRADEDDFPINSDPYIVDEDDE